MRARWMIGLAVAVLGASCIDYTGLGSDSIDYTKVGNTGAGASGEQCLSGSTKCQDGMSNDVCVNTQNDPSHCGACGNACGTPPNATAACVVGQCGVGNCSAGFANCDMDATDGCEVKLATDTAHCGACGNVCSVVNATAACVVGQCGIGNCSAGFANCDMDATDGCEVKLATDAAHCGACGNACVSGKFCQVGACIPVPEGMVSIPAGTFTMGDADNKAKAGMVTVSAFFMDVTEVTTKAYAACVLSNKCTAASTGGSYCNAGVAGRENHPINCVDWNQATAYCAAQGRRLPTEEEWEYAARGTDGRIYPWGNEAPAAQLCWNGAGNDLGAGNRSHTCAVGSYSKGNSSFGLADMAGNVWEWTSSKHGVNDPDSSAARVNRGGSWFNDAPSNVRSADRRGAGPASRYVYLGFRCAGPFSLDP